MEEKLTALTAEVKAFQELWGYRDLREVPGRGICATMRMAFTTGLFFGLTEHDYVGRYCYSDAREAREALASWSGEGDPGGEWIKYKGRGGERSRIPDPFDSENNI